MQPHVCNLFHQQNPPSLIQMGWDTVDGDGVWQAYTGSLAPYRSIIQRNPSLKSSQLRLSCWINMEIRWPCLPGCERACGCLWVTFQCQHTGTVKSVEHCSGKMTHAFAESRRWKSENCKNAGGEVICRGRHREEEERYFLSDFKRIWQHRSL